MPSNNRIIIATAGSGKTTTLVENALEIENEATAIVTYTLNNVGEIKKKFYQKEGRIPQKISVVPWFSFLLQDFVRPYQNFIYNKRIESVLLVNGQSTRGIPKTDIKRYFLSKGTRLYTDKISEFSCLCSQRSNGLVLERLTQLYDRIYIDEVQDLAGYDLELLEILLKSEIGITLVGDIRQATFQTNYSQKNRQFLGPNVINKFKQWNNEGLCSLEYLLESFRCNQSICDFADSIYPDLPKTKSKNEETTGHDGVFVIPSHSVENYVRTYNPQVLRYDRRTQCDGYFALNFGDSKGLTFERVLIFPHGPLKTLLKSGDFSSVSGSAAKLYVATTRARYSVGIVFDGECNLEQVVPFE